MEVSRIPNFGSFGVYLDHVDMDLMDEKTWGEIGQLFVKELVVVFRDIKITKSQYADWIPKWGPLKANIRARFHHKYGHDIDATKPETWHKADDADQKWLASRQYQLEETGDGRFLTRVYGRRDAEGNALGYFSHGEVYWHSNESSSLTFAPAVSLLGWEHMHGSATGFCQTVDLYESFPESFRKELDEMVLIHEYRPGGINENEITDEILSLHMKMAFCPEDGMETPLICQAPNGRKGLRYTVNSRARIKDMTQDETQALFDYLDKLVFDKKSIFDHHYEQSRCDLLVFDNSVTQHRRLGGHPDRKAFRMQFDLSPLLGNAWLPWAHHPEYHRQYCKQLRYAVDVVQGDLKARMKLPA
jgi:alpha-ketoglutarate-dependent taurine dioxygenase